MRNKILNDTSPQIPHYLKDLIGFSSGTWKKLTAAWDGLNDETKILLLQHLKEIDGPSELKLKLYETALESHNSYIRYLSAMWLTSRSWNNKAIKSRVLKKVEKDNNPIVQYCELENKWLYGLLKEKPFWDYPHEARLAIMRGDRVLAGEELFEIMKEGVDKYKNNKLSWEELNEAIEEFTEYNLINDY